MKKVLFVFSLVWFSAFSQKDVRVLTVYLSDAETGKSVHDAKVTLEGFEIPAIKGKYDKKNKLYYFDNIPNGYNTVMAYHKNYNEKGFQNTAGLPKELKLKFYNPYRVKISGDSLNYYKEDTTKMILVFNDQNIESVSKCEGFNDNSFLCSVKKYVNENYPEVTVKSELGLSTLSYNGVLIERVDKKKFKRFNDPVIKRIQDDKNILVFYGLLLKTKAIDSKSNTKREYFSNEGKPLYRAKYLRYINFDTINRSSIGYKGSSRYTGVNLDYRKKYMKGLLINNVYKYTKQETDSMYAADRMKMNKGGLFDFDLEAKDTTSVNMYSLMSNMPSDTMKFLPYKALSNLLDYDSLEKDYKDGKVSYSFYYSKDKIRNYEKARDRVEAKKSNSGSTIYKLKNNLSSPFGMLDLIEYYYLKAEAIYQKTENISKNDNT